MTELSYQTNVERGVTGPSAYTCLLASYDRVSKITGIKPQTYEQYYDLSISLIEKVGNDSNYVPQDIMREFRDIEVDFRQQLGVYTPKNVVEARIETEDILRQTLGKLARGGYRTAVYLDIDGLHTVGVEQIDEEHYVTKSTWTPFSETEPVSVADLFERLYQAPRIRIRDNSSRKTTKVENLIALPPERK